MAQKIMEKLLCTEHGYPTLNEMAEQLNMSPRTLRRRLSAENTGYARLMEQSRQRNALNLLDNPRFSIADVAHRLGYGDMANFTRAFKKWTGTTPSGYRAYLKAWRYNSIQFNNNFLLLIYCINQRNQFLKRLRYSVEVNPIVLVKILLNDELSW